MALNKALPADVRVLAVRAMPPDFVARHAALGKAYTYVLHRGAQRSPFLARYCWSGTRPLDLARMHAAAARLLGEHDCAGLGVRLKDKPDQNTVCTLAAITLREWGPFVLVTVRGDRFLYRMVRRLTGLLVAAGSGRLPWLPAPEDLKSHPAELAFETAPAAGLYLEKVFLPGEAPAAFVPGPPPFLQLLGAGPAAELPASGPDALAPRIV